MFKREHWLLNWLLGEGSPNIFVLQIYAYGRFNLGVVKKMDFDSLWCFPVCIKNFRFSGIILSEGFSFLCVVPQFLHWMLAHCLLLLRVQYLHLKGMCPHLGLL